MPRFRGRLTRRDARYPGTVTVYYPLHPLYGRGELPVHRRYGIGEVEQVEVKTGAGRQAVPVWMTDEQQCRHMTLGLDPRCSLASLSKLLSLLGSVRW